MYSVERWHAHTQPVEYQLHGCNPACVYHSIAVGEQADVCPICHQPYTVERRCWRCAIDESYRAHRRELEAALSEEFTAEMSRPKPNHQRLHAINGRFSTQCPLFSQQA